MKRQVIFAIALLTAISSEMAAQRTMNGQYFVSARLSHDFSSAESFGGGLSFGQYLLNSYWYSSFAMDNRSTSLSSGHDMDCTDFFVEGGWMYRFAATNTRRLCCYAGGSAFVGYQSYDTFDKLPSNIRTGLGAGSFLYGLIPAVELEYFIFRKVALTFRASMPVQIDSPTGWIKWSLGLGARFNL